MGKLLSASLVMLGLPMVVFVGGAWLMLALSQRHELDLKPLNQRFGYRLQDVELAWEALGKEGRSACCSKRSVGRSSLDGAQLAPI